MVFCEIFFTIRQENIFVDYPSQSDLKIIFVKYKSQSGGEKTLKNIFFINTIINSYYININHNTRPK